MQLSYSALLVAALSFGSAIALPGDKLGRYADYSSREPSSFVSQYLTRVFDRIHYRHQHKHKRDAVDYSTIKYTNLDLSGVDFSTINYGGGSTATGAPVAANVVTTTATSAASSTASASSTSSSTPDTSNESNSGSVVEGGPDYSSPTQTYNALGFGATTVPSPNDTSPDVYVGNLGSPLGSNILMIKAADAYKYTYTNQVINASPSQLTFVIWNNGGSDTSLDPNEANSGASSAKIFTWSLAAGASQFLAFDENTQGAMSRQCSENKAGQPDCTWVEFDFGNIPNKGYSGYDVSSIPSSSGDVEKVSVTSSCGTSSSNSYTSRKSKRENNWTSATQVNQGAGAVCGPGPVHIQTTFKS
ncbi:hypothetical protein MMC12_008075 [Toensbergia leucococca]|nr:hypothetical protein [Toensbergia leucococca]